MKIEVIARFEVPDEITRTDIREFVKDALGSWGGALRPPGGYGPGDPGDPLFGLRDVSVSRVTILK